MTLKKRQQSLVNWGKQDWRTKSGKKSSETGERYLPAAAIKSLSSAEYAATTRAKREGKKKGQQFVKQPKKIAKKTRKFRASEGGIAMKLKKTTDDQVGLKKLPTAVRNKMGYMNKGGMPKKKGYAKGGKMNDMRKTGMFYGGMSRRGK